MRIRNYAFLTKSITYDIIHTDNIYKNGGVYNEPFRIC